MFYLFGSIGFVWVLLWIVLYTEVRTSIEEEEFIQPPKVCPPMSSHGLARLMPRKTCLKCIAPTQVYHTVQLE